MFIQYIKSYFYSLRKNSFFYTINFLGFSIGILLVTIILTFAYQELSFDRFHKNAENIYRVNGGGYGVTPLCFAEKLRNKVPDIRNIIRFSSGNLKLEKNNKKLDFGKLYYTDPEIFQVFSFKLLSGNTSGVLKDPYSIVLSKSKAKELFSDNSPIGKTLKDKNGGVYTVTGVMKDIPYNSHIQSEAFVSIETLKSTGELQVFDCKNWSILTYIHLSEKSIPRNVEKKINNVLEKSRMKTGDDRIPLELEPLKDIYLDYENNKYDGSKHGNFQTVMLYLAISILLLSIVVINYINLSTAISIGRAKEVAIRKINGAKQSDIIKQIVLEAMGTAIISFFVALVFIELFLPQISALLNIQVSDTFYRLYLYAFYFIGIVIIGLITGLFPGVFLSKVKPVKVLKNETILKSRGFQQKILLVFQLLIVATLVNSTFIIRSQIDYILEKDIGFNYENVISFGLNKELERKKELLKNKLLENSDIKHVSFSGALIGEGFAKSPIGNNENKKLCYRYSIDPDYLKLYNIDIRYGRNFSWDISTDFTKTCIINEEASRAFGFENPVNKALNNKKIIGVVSDFNYTSLHNKIEPLVIYCSKDGSIAQTKISDVNQTHTIKHINNTCKNISPDFDFNYQYLENKIKTLYKSELDLKNSFQLYSIIMFIIVLLGLFSLNLFLLKKKKKEIGIRKLFGAKMHDTLLLMTRKQMWIVLFANIIAMPVTYLTMEKWLNNYPFRIDISYLIFLKTLLITIVFTILVISYLMLKVYKMNLINTLRKE